MPSILVRARFALVATGMLALLAAMWAGLVRLGWALPPLHPGLAMAHGPLMVSGFLGTVVALERAVALGRAWGYAAPALTALGALALVTGAPAGAGALLIALGSLGAVAAMLALLRRHPALFALIMAAGTAAWAVGNAVWVAGGSLAVVAPWWMAFLVLVIAGERLELSRVLLLSPAVRTAFLAVTGLYVAGLALAPAWPAAGARLAGAGMLGLAAWLLRHDVARRTIRLGGLTRFIAAALLSGYVWLAAAGLLTLFYGPVTGGPIYDAILHAVFLGFVFAMIFGHAPIIFPAVLKVPIPYRPAFYAHLVLLHLSLLLRVAGDVTEVLALRRWGGLLNVTALLLFVGNTAWSARRGPADR